MMNKTINYSDNTDINLQPLGFIHADHIGPGSTIVCNKGILWLTQTNDLKDYMLNPGDKLTVKKETNLLIEALSEARLSIVHNN